MKCIVDGCEAEVLCRGYCNPHYQRFLRHGDPLAGRTRVGEPMRFFREVVIAYRGDECLTWPFVRTSDGYGQIKIAGKMKLVHRLACEEQHGAPPTEKHEAAHRCGNGHLGCCNPGHLRWASMHENLWDRLGHGTLPRGEKHPLVKLTEAEVFAIRASRDQGVSARVLADYFGVTSRTIYQIGKRESWSWLNDQNEKDGNE